MKSSHLHPPTLLLGSIGGAEAPTHLALPGMASLKIPAPSVLPLETLRWPPPNSGKRAVAHAALRDRIPLSGSSATERSGPAMAQAWPGVASIRAKSSVRASSWSVNRTIDSQKRILAPDPDHRASLVVGHVRSPDHARAQGVKGVWRGCPRQ